MRTTYIVSILLLASAFLLVISRHHIRDLSEIIRTYTTFHAYLERNQDTLFRYPPPASTPSEFGLDTPVPKVIHQIFLSDGRLNTIPAQYEPAIKTCKDLHPTWKFYMWTDEEGRGFIKEHYPEIWPHYISYKQNIQRANILRYAVLHRYGGVYLDLDVSCRAALDAPLQLGSTNFTITHLPWLTPGAYPAGVNNAFVLARPQHPFLTEVLARVPSRDLSWGTPYVENMLTTGCMYISNVWTAFAHAQERARKNKQTLKEDRIYVLADEAGALEPHMLRGKVITPLFEHGGASSWHGWDAAAIVLIGEHYGYFIAALGATLGIFTLGIWKLGRRILGTKHRRRLNWGAATARFSLEKTRLDIQDAEFGLLKAG